MRTKAQLQSPIPTELWAIIFRKCIEFSSPNDAWRFICRLYNSDLHFDHQYHRNVFIDRYFDNVPWVKKVWSIISFNFGMKAKDKDAYFETLISCSIDACQGYPYATNIESFTPQLLHDRMTEDKSIGSRLQVMGPIFDTESNERLTIIKEEHDRTRPSLHPSPLILFAVSCKMTYSGIHTTNYAVPPEDENQNNPIENNPHITRFIALVIEPNSYKWIPIHSKALAKRRANSAWSAPHLLSRAIIDPMRTQIRLASNVRDRHTNLDYTIPMQRFKESTESFYSILKTTAEAQETFPLDFCYVPKWEMTLVD
uniref:Uncharacterized protein n=1 Tax=Clandestinovirus TaxID=2831644 RepID=A0A8F8KM27_9VIRU|nr:hypothetical protein KOM_12_374 [Clandestinovirus]